MNQKELGDYAQAARDRATGKKAMMLLLVHASRRQLLIGMGFTFAGLGVNAENLPDLIERTKPSVILVGTFDARDSPRFTFRGTGFVVADGNHALTNAHVLPSSVVSGPGRRLAVQLLGVDGRWVMREVTVVAVDTLHDLVLLRFDGPSAPALKLAAPLPVKEGTSVAFIGFPVGGALGFSHVTHRGIVAARTSMVLPLMNAQMLNERAASQLRQTPFEILQLDATAYPGNSGGPLFDQSTGEVIGVISMVLIKGTRESALSAPSGITYAIPSSFALPMLMEK